MKNEIRILKSAEVKAMLPPRKAVSNKGTYGKAAILAGSMRYSGAAALAAQGALCGGAGYVALCVPRRLKIALIGRLPEAILLDVCPGGEWKFRPKNLRSILQYNSIAAGMGMGNTKNTAKIIAFLLKNYEGKLLIDADGINALARFYGANGSAELFKAKKCAALITPAPLRICPTDGIRQYHSFGKRRRTRDRRSKKICRGERRNGAFERRFGGKNLDCERRKRRKRQKRRKNRKYRAERYGKFRAGERRQRRYACGIDRGDCRERCGLIFGGMRGRVSCGKSGRNRGETDERICAHRHEDRRIYRQSDSRFVSRRLAALFSGGVIFM